MTRIALVLGLAVAFVAAALVLRGSPATEPSPVHEPPAAAGSGASGNEATAPSPAAASRADAASPPGTDGPDVAVLEGTGPDAAASPFVPLEKLLTLEGAGIPTPGVPGLADPRPPPWAPKSGRRMRLEHSAERAELGSERQIRDEFRFSVPLDDSESLRLRGGVQVDRQQSDGDQDLGAGPAIGVEKRF